MAVEVNNSVLNQFFAFLMGLPWLEILAKAWKYVRKLWRGLADEGMYEVLEHEATLEIVDKAGKKALVQKRQKVRYLQNNIIAYQDQAWGDGQILINYRCAPGVEADRYRVAHETHILISLQEVKKRGDIDEFKISWEFRNGFTHSSEYWATEVSHRTKKLKIQVVFPKERLPQQIWCVEYLRKRTRTLSEGLKKLPDGRFQASWEVGKPRLNERYGLKWDW